MGSTRLYNLIENPPKSPFVKGGLSKGFLQLSPSDEGGVGGIYIRDTVNKNWHLIPGS